MVDTGRKLLEARESILLVECLAEIGLSTCPDSKVYDGQGL